MAPITLVTLPTINHTQVMHSFPIPPLHAASKANNSFTLWLLGGQRALLGGVGRGELSAVHLCLAVSASHSIHRGEPTCAHQVADRQTDRMHPTGGRQSSNTCHLATDTPEMAVTPSAKNPQAFNTLFNLMCLSLILNCIYRH